MGRIFVDDYLDVGVCLQVRGGQHRVDVPFDNLLDDIGLVLAPGHEDNLLGVHDGADTHRDGHLRGVLQSEEGTRLRLARVVVELYHTRARLGVGARLVEANLAVLAHADNHQVDVAGGAVVRSAVLRNLVLGNRAVGNVDVLGQDVDVVEEILMDAVVAALLLARLDGVELVEAVDGHVAEADLALLVALYQLVVEAQRRAAGGQTQHEGCILVVDLVRAVALVVVANHLHDDVGDILYTQIFVLVDRGANLLVAMDDVAGGGAFDESAVLRK